MKYEQCHSSGTQGGKCIICGKQTYTFWGVSKNSNNANFTQYDAKIEIPVCDEHFKLLTENKKEILIQVAKTINTICKN